MQVTNPQEPFKGHAPQNVFVAVNELGMQAGYGYVYYQYQPEIYPDRPVNIYFNMEECLPEAEYLVYGALVARARQMHAVEAANAAPGEESKRRARLYTNVAPGDTRRLEFFSGVGMGIENTEDLVRLKIPQTAGPELFSCTIIQPALNTVQEQQALVDRLRLSGFNYSLTDLQMLRTHPCFHVWGVLYGSSLVAECVVAGNGQSAEVVAIYVVPQMQRHGIGKHLLGRALIMLAQEGVTEITARIMNASIPQRRLMSGFGAEVVDQTMLFPGIKIDL